jgi:MFS transporter, FHS family, glucose/mannose:H+ symporter
MSERTAKPPHSTKFISAALFAGFILTGMVCTILGPILPVFIARWNLTDAQAGLFFTTQFGGSLAGVALSSAILAARGYREALLLGFFLMAGGVAGLNSGNEHAALLATAIFGFGFGVAIPATNLCTAEIAGARRSSALNILNMAWGIGAILCPLFILAGIKTQHITEPLLTIALAALFLSILFWTMKFPQKTASLNSSSEITHNAPEAEDNTHPIYVPIALALLFYLYVGTENGVSGWAAEEARRIGVGTAATLAPMFFWTGLLSGRGISAIILSRVKENLLVVSGLLLSAAGTACLLLASTQLQILLGVLAAGFGFSGVYPIFIAWLSKWYGERARRLGGLMFSLASVGGATVPWIVGFVSQRAQSLRIGLLVPLAGSLAMIVLVAVLRRRISA